MNYAKKKGDQNPIKNNEPIILPDLNGRIAELAYYKSENRGFEPGYELNDWLEAEHELIYFGNN